MVAVLAAVENGQLEIVKYLIEHDAEVNAVDKDGRTTLMLAVLAAVENGRLEIVKYLIQHDGDVDIIDSYGWTALMYAKKNKDETVANYLEKSGSYFGRAKNYIYSTPRLIFTNINTIWNNYKIEATVLAASYFIVIGIAAYYNYKKVLSDFGVSPGFGKFGGDVCAICYEGYTNTCLDICKISCGGTGLVKTATHLAACGHTFHPGCLIEWFEQRPSCPMCNR